APGGAAGIPEIATGPSSAASTQPILAVEPVVTRTNHGRAMKVIEEPVSETSSAVISPSRERFLSMAKIIKRPYGFVKWECAEGQPGARRRPPGPDPRRRRPRLRPLGLRGRDDRAARGGDRPLARRDLQLLREQGRPLRRARRV